jgi:hypothetical protein
MSFVHAPDEQLTAQGSFGAQRIALVQVLDPLHSMMQEDPEQLTSPVQAPFSHSISQLTVAMHWTLFVQSPEPLQRSLHLGSFAGQLQLGPGQLTTQTPF